MSTEIKAKRSAALEEKRRRLEELKARRNQRSSDSNSFSAVTASKNGSLDEYIDDLLNSAPPVVPATSGLPEVSGNQPVVSNAVQSAVKEVSKIDQLNEKSVSIAPSSGTPVATVSPVKRVEMFNSSTQTEEDDFPVVLADENEHNNITAIKSAEVDPSLENEEKKEIDGGAPIESSLLSEEDIKLTLSSKPFYNFINSASKKVERLLGAPLLADLLVDDAVYYADKESKKDAATSTREKEHSLISAQVSFSFPKWTSDRDVTSLDWSPHHRGEMMLASYHMPYFSKTTMGSTAISGLASHTTSSASLVPRSKTEMTESDGLAILWNLAMPSRPEHIFTCGSPVLSAKFHPIEGPLVVGGCYSGQIVVWDVRNGRLPVQRSTLNILGGSTGIGGHVHSIVGLEPLDVSSFKRIFLNFSS
jgi:dynein intermediate chain